MSEKKPFFLLCNDDGVHAPGINVLAEALRPFGRVMIVAPHLERSASSSAISISMPIIVEKIEDDVFAALGTPADCMMLALRELVHEKPTWVLSGINRGGNLGTDTIYSGTVGAAVEGSLLGVPSMAISVEGSEPLHYESAAEVVKQLVVNDDIREIASRGVLNVNVPNLPFSDIEGMQVSSLGRRIYHGFVQERMDPRGRPYYWMGRGALGHEQIPGSDCVTITKRMVTLTMLKPDLYDAQATDELQNIAPELQKF